MSSTPPIPDDITLHRHSRILELHYADGTRFELPCEYLRVYSPSAEVQGHSPEERVLQVGKERVAIERIEPVGRYALKLVFDDGHDTGLYTWDYLHLLGRDHERLWQQYLDELVQIGYRRPPQSV